MKLINAQEMMTRLDSKTPSILLKSVKFQIMKEVEAAWNFEKEVKVVEHDDGSKTCMIKLDDKTKKLMTRDNFPIELLHEWLANHGWIIFIPPCFDDNKESELWLNQI